MKINRKLDLMEVECPMVVLRLRLELNKMDDGEVVEVKSSDVGSVNEISCYCRYGVMTLLSSKIDIKKNIFTYVIKK